MYEQNIICSQTLLDGIAHEQTIICRQLFAGHLVGSRPMKRKKNLLRMIIIMIVFFKFLNFFVEHSLNYLKNVLQKIHIYIRRKGFEECKL